MTDNLHLAFSGITETRTGSMPAKDWSQYRGRRIRLDRSLYAIPFQIIAITIGTQHRRAVFDQASLVEDCIQELRSATSARDIHVLVYCFMPDHLHLLLQPRTDTDLIEFVQRYKSWTTRLAWEHGKEGKVWQPRFYDHILREDDDPMRHMRYIAENPVRAQLVKTWNEYRFLGSFVYDLNTFDW
jgi:putative transposase